MAIGIIYILSFDKDRVIATKKHTEVMMKKLISPAFKGFLGLGGPVMIYGGIAGFIHLVKVGGFARVIGGITTLVGTLFILALFLVLVHDTVWPAIATLMKKTKPHRMTA